MEDTRTSPCDACENDNANLRCSVCQCYYYCSKICQKKHWKTHKEECAAIVQNNLSLREKDKKMDIFVEKSQEASDECCICFEQIDANQLQLPCNHIFCVECMRKVNMESDCLDCPLCRSETDGFIHQYLMKNIVMFVQRARRSPLKRAHYCRLARLEYAKMKTMEEDYNKNLEDCMTVKIMIADLSFVERDYITAEKESLEVVRSNALSGDALVDTLMNIAASRMELENYTGAIESYTDIYRRLGDDFQQYKSARRQIYHDMSRCFYHISNYQKSIDIGSVAVAINRHYDGVYTYIALSHKALGNLDSAIAIMKKAKRYETPWDKDNCAIVKEFYDSLVLYK
jgi:hypothetical protein